MDTARKINGLGFAGATALFSTLYPNRFGIVDQFVIKNLQAAKSLSNDALIKAIKPSSINKKRFCIF
ncbi:MAG TPA: hypothetical protein PLR16_03430 [Bacilli bacterium]|nr:hypothetical protein [Bacilli bacterium]